MEAPLELMREFSQEVLGRPLSMRARMLLQNSDETEDEKYETDEGDRRRWFLKTTSQAKLSKSCKEFFNRAEYDFDHT